MKKQILLTFFLFPLLIFLIGCSQITSGKYFTLKHANKPFSEIEIPQWVVKARGTTFGTDRPPLYSVSMGSSEENILVYPIFLKRRTSIGPAFFPLVPTPESLNVFTKKYELKFVYTGMNKKLEQLIVNGNKLDISLVDKIVYSDGIEYKYQLDSMIMKERKINIKIIFEDSDIVSLDFSPTWVTSIIPATIPL